MKTLKDYYGVDEQEVRAILRTPLRKARMVYDAGYSLFTYKALGVVIYLFSFVAFYRALEAQPIRLVVAGFGVSCLLVGSYLIINKQ